MNARITVAALAITLFVLGGCVQMPTEKQGVSDLRPQISFVAEGHHDAQVFIDGAAVGRVGDYLEGKAALRVLPGTHVVRVVSGTRVVLEERFYVGDGVSRSFIVR